MKLPHNLEAEIKILGSFLLDNDFITDIADQIKADYFYSPANKLIFETMMEMHFDKTVIDIITLCDKLKTSNIPVSYIAELTLDVVYAKLARPYVKILHDLYYKRELMILSETISQDIKDDNKVDDIVSSIMDKVFSLATDEEGKIVTIKQTLSATISQIEAAYENKGMSGVPTGLIELDEILCGLKGRYYVLAARPGLGKSAMANCVSIACGVDKKKALIFSLEMPKEEIGVRMLASEGNINTHNLENGNVRDDDWPKMMKAAGDLSDLQIFIDDSASQTDMSIWTKARRHKAKHGLDIIIIDYIQLMKSAKKTNNREQEIAEISRNLKKMSKDLKIPVLALAQLSRECEKEKRKPRLSDLRESGSIEQDADVVMFLHRPYDYDESKPKNIVEVLIAKHRGGRKGIVRVDWKPEYTKFRDTTERSIHE